MTEKEAINGLEILTYQCKHNGECGTCNICCSAIPLAIQALEEIQQYREYKEIFESHFSKEALELLSDKEEFGKWLKRGKWIAKKCDEINRKLESFEAIGTIEEFKALKEKNEPKEPDYQGDGCWDGHVIIDTWICPSCGKHYEVDYDDYDYCPNCGQHIDHSGLTEDD